MVAAMIRAVPRSRTMVGRRGPAPPSLWLADRSAPEPGSIPALPRFADVIVVGGGIMGVSVAYWLSRHGADVLLLESRGIAWGATGRNAGLMLAAPRPLEDIRSTIALLSEEGIDAELEEAGHLALTGTPSVWEKIRDEVARRPLSASPLHAIDRNECEAALGCRINPTILGGRWLPNAALVHPVRFARELARRAQRRGLAIAYPVRATGVKRKAGRHLTRVVTTRGEVQARTVVLACAAATATLYPGARGLLSVRRAHVCSTRSIPRLFRIGLALDWGTYYWRQTTDGRVIIGGPGAPRESAAILPWLFPDFPRFRIERQWTGIMDETPDRRPIVGRSLSERSLWLMAGFGGHGLPLAIGVGRALADSVMTDQPSPLLEALDPARFTRDKTC